MLRPILDESRIHEGARKKIGDNHRDIIDEVDGAAQRHPVLVVGMAQNPHCRRARKFLQGRGTAFEYLEYGSYLNTWRRRNALKMWTGWPTFPMVFVKGTFIGGADQLEQLAASGELDRLIAD